MNKLTAYTFKHSDDTFRRALDVAGIKHVERRHFPAGTPVASGVSIEIIITGGWGALAVACLVWGSARKSRHIKVTMKDGQVVELKGYGAEEAAVILESAESLAAIDTEKEPDNQD